MKRADIERLRDIADAGGCRILADALLDSVRQLANELSCEGRLLKHGVSFQRGPGNAVFAFCVSRTATRGTVEFALADKNLPRLCRRTADEVQELLVYLAQEIGPRVKSPTSQQYPRIAVDNVAAGQQLIQVFSKFFAGLPYHLVVPNPPEPQPRITTDEQTLAAIWTRRGQQEFRSQLLTSYQARCAITGCDAVEALEAAHIIPFAECRSYELANGILMRADVHTLFDLFLISVDPSDLTVRVAPEISRSYGEFDARELSLPIEPNWQPDRIGLQRHFAEWQARKSA